MAGRTRKTAETAETNVEMPETEGPAVPSFLGTLGRSEGVMRKRSATIDNDPTYQAIRQAVQTSVNEGALYFLFETEAEAKRVASLMLRAAQQDELSLSKSVTERDGMFRLDFQAGTQKRTHKYTTADIRQWALETHGITIEGKVPTDIREAFKLANGFAK